MPIFKTDEQRDGLGHYKTWQDVNYSMPKCDGLVGSQRACALKNVVDILNDTPHNYSKVSRVELFAKTEVRPNLRQHHHFGVPTYVLDDKAQAGFKLS
jgi:hypothetical protein